MTSHQIEQRAAEWLMRSSEPDWSAQAEAERDAWLAESDAHKAAYWRLEAGWHQADRLRALRSHDVQDELAPRRRAGWLWQAAATIVLVLGVGSFVWSGWSFGLPPPETTRFATAVGVRKTIELNDGSRIEMNTGSEIRASLDASTRTIWLDKGEAYFDIAKRNGQRFVVHAGTKTVTVLGTKFVVRRDGDKVTVIVEEGRVRVEDSVQTGPERATIIAAGQLAIARGPSTLVTTKGSDEVESALAWRDGMLSFDQRALSEVAAEFNRYNERKVLIGDVEAGDIRIGGTFKASNVDAFVRLLRDAYGLKVEENATSITISK